MSNEEKLLAAIRGAIAIKQIPKKSLARKCKISRPYFSEMLHGDRKMPQEVRERLIKELGIKKGHDEWKRFFEVLLENCRSRCGE
jgi:hypothetical protein